MRQGMVFTHAHEGGGTVINQLVFSTLSNLKEDLAANLSTWNLLVYPENAPFRIARFTSTLFPSLHLHAVNFIPLRGIVPPIFSQAGLNLKPWVTETQPRKGPQLTLPSRNIVYNQLDIYPLNGTTSKACTVVGYGSLFRPDSDSLVIFLLTQRLNHRKSGILLHCVNE